MISYLSYQNSKTWYLHVAANLYLSSDRQSLSKLGNYCTCGRIGWGIIGIDCTCGRRGTNQNQILHLWEKRYKPNTKTALVGESSPTWSNSSRLLHFWIWRSAGPEIHLVRLDSDHVTPKPKETSVTTCRWPNFTEWIHLHFFDIGYHRLK